MDSLIFTYKVLILQCLLCLSLSLLLYFLNLSSLFLRGLNTYIHPDGVNPTKPQSTRVAIRRPSEGIDGYQSLSSKTASELRNRKKPKEKFDFDESNAQIFRLKLGDAHLSSRLYFDSYRSSFNCFFVGCSSFLLHCYFNANDGILRNGSLVPILLAVIGLFRVIVSLVRVSLERSAFTRSERQLGLVAGISGFVLAHVICLGIFPSIFDFEFKEVDGYGMLFVGFSCGSIAGFLYMAAGKSARAFWIGTDQIRCNLSIISCEWIARMTFYVTYLVSAYTSLIWISPFAEFLSIKSISDDKTNLMIDGVGRSEKYVGNVGMAQADFRKFRFWCLLLLGVLQIFSVRSNLQMYLNEAVLSWYQRLHASKVPDLGYSRAKVFLHNHYLCVAVLQFFAPAALILLFLGLSQIDGGVFENFQLICGILPCSAFCKEVAVFMAWWVAFVSTFSALVNLGLYRRGILYIS
ncbi:hypothetical protein Nepgr_010843 [Nepenthes gracilis]|uniref:Transmembrane protein n=1 Tax=Nepenthes gracilis TaxID=150966 RepID=A0AAD3SD49_NEPGR|nr:hypothetical protein Nepgr_010843 [Nepenthes gracilis]